MQIEYLVNIFNEDGRFNAGSLCQENGFSSDKYAGTFGG